MRGRSIATPRASAAWLSGPVWARRVRARLRERRRRDAEMFETSAPPLDVREDFEPALVDREEVRPREETLSPDRSRPALSQGAGRGHSVRRVVVIARGG